MPSSHDLNLMNEENAEEIIRTLVHSFITHNIMLVVDDDVYGGKTTLNPDEVVDYLKDRNQMFADRHHVSLEDYLEWKEWAQEPMNFGIGPEEYLQQQRPEENR